MKKTNKKSKYNLLIYILIFISMFGLMFNLTFKQINGLYIEMPGTANNLKDMITVNNKKDKQKGEFRLTSVGIMKATPIFALRALVSPVDSFISQSDLMGNANMAEYDEMQKYYMETSENTAKMMALKLAKKPYEMQYQGVYVMSIDDASDFKKSLEIGDLITKVNGQSFKSADEMIKSITSGKDGDKISLQIKRDKKEMTIEGKLKNIPSINKPGIGVGLVTKTAVKSPYKIDFKVGDIGGPSAGMMFTLETYELLSNKDLRKGRNIAGTGEILPDGSIGRIGGIEKKVVAAEKAGATVFLAPDDKITSEMRKYNPEIKTNYEEAKEMAKKMHLKIKVVPVKTIEDAINYLENSK